MGHVRQNAALDRFEMDVAGGTALAFYRLADGVMMFTHTEVPAALRGRGIGSRMMHGVLQSVRAQGLKVIPRCPFVADFIDRHPAYADLLA
jgi:predicted GNAT family acetyltransferase